MANTLLYVLPIHFLKSDTKRTHSERMQILLKCDAFWTLLCILYSCNPNLDKGIQISECNLKKAHSMLHLREHISF